MERLKRYFYQNKKKIFKIIGIIVIVLIAIQLLNLQAKKKLEEKNTQINTIDYGKDIAIITDTKKTTTEYSEEKNIMQKFVEYCNNKEYEKAYELLSDTCKQTMYPNVNLFKSNYCEINFTSKKTCGFQLWSGSTYLVEIREDLMATGKYNKNEYLQDYYTVINNKLNIAGYVGRMYIDKEATNSNVTIKVDSIDFYMEYTNVNIKVANKTDQAILLDPQEETKNSILMDDKDVKYTGIVEEKIKNELMVNKKETKDISIKYYATYRNTLKFSSIHFKKVILDYNKFIQGADTTYVGISIGI